MARSGLAALLALSTAAAAESPPEERRITWGGLIGSALAPSDARALEMQLIEALGKDARVYLMDAGGRPLGDSAREAEVARVRSLLREGVDAMLRERHEEGRNRIDRAVALFESELGTHPDHDVLHDALLAQSESLFTRGQTEAARTTLERLHALSPRLAPEEPRGLVALWKRVIREKPRFGRLEVTAAAGAVVYVDGRALGEAPVVLPRIVLGEHLLGVAWHDTLVSRTVQVTAGRPSLISVERPELAEKARAELAAAAQTRLGPATVTGAIPRLATMASANEVVLAIVRPEGRVLLARHGADGMLRRIVGGRLADGVAPGTPEAARLAADLVAAVVPDEPLGGFELEASGAPRSSIGAANEAYGGTAPAPPVALAALRTTPREGWVDAPSEPDEPDSILSSPWLWAIVGGVVAGGVVAGVVLGQPTPETTLVHVILPSGGRSTP